MAPRASRYRSKVKRGMSGLGLFAEEDIPRGAFVIEYWGDVLTDDEADARGGKYLFRLDNGKTVDGSPRKNIARYINHSCAPNCEVDIRGDHIYISTIRKVKAGEELTYDYDTEYFDYYIKPRGCRCHACLRKKKR